MALFLRTVAGLRPVQWWYLPLRRVQARLPARAPAVAARADLAALARALERLGPDGADTLLERADRVARGEFHFLGHEERLPAPDWNRRHVSHLWSYNLHYFDYARDLAHAYRRTGDPRYAEAFASLALSWSRQARPGGSDGWEPYAVSLRVVNWIQALALFGEGLAPGVRAELEGSVARQVGWLHRRLERHLQANHLQKNFHALALAGLCFEGRAAERWRAVGLAGMWRAAREQILDDGGHLERSPMYHAIALGDFLELLLACGARGEPVPADVLARVGRMADAMRVLARPDGSLHLFNDAAHGIAPSAGFLAALARECGLRRPPPGAGTAGALSLPATGYHLFQDRAAGERLLFDCGEPGPRHQPAHVHCDLLSFELDFAGRPVVVDSGVHGYGEDPYREYSRSTRAHNTVQIGAREQSEVWGTFRMARPARSHGSEVGAAGGSIRFEGACSPYWSPRVVHRRRIERAAPGWWEVVDRVENADEEAVVSHLHLHPAFEAWLDGGAVHAHSPDGLAVRIEPFGVARVELIRGASDPVQGWYLPEFGRAEAACAVRMSVAAGARDRFGFRILVLEQNERGDA